MINTGYDPFSKGRWYRFFIESDGQNVTLTSSDIISATITTDSSTAPTYATLNIHNAFHCLDILYDYTFDGNTNAYSRPERAYIDGSAVYVLLGPAAWTSCEVYLFGYFDEISASRIIPTTPDPVPSPNGPGGNIEPPNANVLSPEANAASISMFSLDSNTEDTVSVETVAKTTTTKKRSTKKTSE